MFLCSSLECPTLHTLLMPRTSTRTEGAVLTGGALKRRSTLTYSTFAYPSAITDLLVQRCTGISIHGAAAVFVSPVLITEAATALAPPMTSTDAVGQNLIVKLPTVVDKQKD